jgi:hypothetical protein
MWYLIKRNSDNKYLLNFKSMARLDVNDWTDNINLAQKLTQCRCNIFLSRFPNDDLEVIEYLENN